MAEDTAGRISTPTRQCAEVDWNRGASGPQTQALPPVSPPTYALLGNLPAQADGLILDLACGTGSPSFEVARLNPEARVLGVDRADKLIGAVRALAAAHAIGVARFEVMSWTRSRCRTNPWTRRSRSSGSCRRATSPQRRRNWPAC